MLLNIQELNLYGLRNGVLRLAAGKYKTICRLCPLTAVVSQIRCNNGCMNRWKSGYSKFVALKPLSQRNPFLSLKIQAPSEIIWFEMGYRTDHRTLRQLSLHVSLSRNRAITLYISSLQDDHLSIKRYGMKRSTPVSLLCCYIPLQRTWLAFFLNFFFQPFPQKQVNMRMSESSCS